MHADDYEGVFHYYNDDLDFNIVSHVHLFYFESKGYGLSSLQISQKCFMLPSVVFK